jgi:carbonic anhydrase
VKQLDYLFEANQRWAESVKANDPEFFERSGKLQTPEILWLGCADSRVPPNQIVDLPPGEIFVHRNIANVVVHTDINALSVLNYGINALGTKHVIVCGHYGCGGVMAAMTDEGNSVTHQWLRHVKDVIRLHKDELEALPEDQRTDRLCELNVAEQVRNVCNSTVVRDAWAEGKTLTVHGFIYDIRTGLLKDLEISYESLEQFTAKCPLDIV